ncbi:hypothetical protein GCM10027419_43890 [Pandoraea terrae]
MARAAAVVRIEREGRRWAKQYTLKSMAAIEASWRSAAREGYQAGVAAALTDAAAHFAASRAWCLDRRRQIADEVRQLLRGAVSHPQALLATLDEGLAVLQGAQLTGVLSIRLPESLRKRHDEIAAGIAKAWHEGVAIDYHDGTQMWIWCGDQVLEFDPERYLSEVGPEIGADEANVSEAAQVITSDAMTRLHATIDAALQGAGIRDTTVNQEGASIEDIRHDDITGDNADGCPSGHDGYR